MAIADIDDNYEQLSFACQWVEKPEFYDFDETLRFSWKKGLYFEDEPCGVYSAYGFDENGKWYVEETHSDENESNLNEVKSLTYSRKYGKENISRGQETIFAAVKVRKKYIAEIERL